MVKSCDTLEPKGKRNGEYKADLTAGGVLSTRLPTYNTYVTQRRLIPPEQLCEVHFSALEAKPIAQAQAIYDALSLNYIKHLER